jgi:hypothetical protein
MPPAKPPIPVTEPTALLGNISETVVNKLADQAWSSRHAAQIRISVVLKRKHARMMNFIKIQEM